MWVLPCKVFEYPCQGTSNRNGVVWIDRYSLDAAFRFDCILVFAIWDNLVEPHDPLGFKDHLKHWIILLAHDFNGLFVIIGISPRRDFS